MTSILPQYPGYIWRQMPDGVALDWAPVSTYYSPPVLHPDIYMIRVPIRTMLARGLIIGQHGHHFKRITESTGCLYIFMMQDNIEIWGNREAVHAAQMEIVKHLCNMHLVWRSV
jgi:hypothetical protein